jgi:hypothetical protein
MPWRSKTAIAMFPAGPVIWSAHFSVVYLEVADGCTGDGPGLTVFDPRRCPQRLDRGI